MKDDGYGSIMREALKKSMAEPATPYKALNRVEHPQFVRFSTLVIVFAFVLWLGVMGVFLLDKLESTHRTPIVEVQR